MWRMCLLLHAATALEVSAMRKKKWDLEVKFIIIATVCENLMKSHTFEAKPQMS